MVTVKITETYDLKTTINKLGLIGVHTPTDSLLQLLYPGLCKNYRYVRLKRCDITGVCASVLPADPLQVGVSSGDVAPEDMFNPILYKPVSNSSFDTIISRIYCIGNNGAGSGNSVDFDADGVSGGVADAWTVYYSQLAEAKRWKKAMPQNGFALRGLYPICHTVLNTYGNVKGINNLTIDDDNDLVAPDLANIKVVDKALNITSVDPGQALTLRGKSVKMPKFPLHTTMESAPDGNTFSNTVFSIPKTFVAMFLLPPARLHEFYYRMRVTWTVQFIGPCSVVEASNGATNIFVQGSTYSKNFTYPSKSLGAESSLVDTSDVSIKKIMES